MIVAQDDSGRAFALAEYAARTSSTELNSEVFAMNRKWRCHRFGVEASAQQYLYYESIVREAHIRGERIVLIPVEQPTNQTKEWRITTTIQEWMHNGMLFVADDCHELRKQLKNYPNGVLCDVVDALASALRLLRNPFATRRRLEFDEDHDDITRWRNDVRRDNRYAPFARR